VKAVAKQRHKRHLKLSS